MGWQGIVNTHHHKASKVNETHRIRRQTVRCPRTIASRPKQGFSHLKRLTERACPDSR